MPPGFNDYTEDGRQPFAALHRAFSALSRDGWIEEQVTVSIRERGGSLVSLPLLSFRTPHKGPAVWLISGIHGEEPVGPNALAEGVDFLMDLGKETPVVLFPVCNPVGYASNWRYLNMPVWDKDVVAHSVGDSEHVLPSFDDPGVPRAAQASSPEAQELVRAALALSRDYPPVMSIDFHEDDLIPEGYVYSKNGPGDPVAARIVRLLAESGIPIKESGHTRFEEPVIGGIVTSGKDGSFDEMLASGTLIVDGKTVQGPQAKTAIVVETPAGALSLAERKAAVMNILRHLEELRSLAFGA